MSVSSDPCSSVALALGVRASSYRAHLHSGSSPARIHRAFLFAALPVAIAAVVLYGRRAALLMVLGMGGGLAGEALIRWIAPRVRRFEVEHAALMGLLLAFTFPPNAGWFLPLFGGFIAIAVGKGLLGGPGNYIWHPALVGWAALVLFFTPQMAPERWPFLAIGRLVHGDLRAASVGPNYRGFELSPPPPGVHAWLRPRPIDAVLARYRAPSFPLTKGGQRQPQSLAECFRDELPPWSDTIWGTVGGGIGETCTIALLLGGLYLIHCGYARWQSIAAALMAVGTLAAVLPLRLDSASPTFTWFPILQVQDGFPVGWATVLFHLTGDGLLLAVLVLAADPPTTPLTTRGHFLLGLGVGVLTMVARVLGLTPGSTYWAILFMNTTVPLVDRVVKRRVRDRL